MKSLVQSYCTLQEQLVLYRISAAMLLWLNKQRYFNTAASITKSSAVIPLHMLCVRCCPCKSMSDVNTRQTSWHLAVSGTLLTQYEYRRLLRTYSEMIETVVEHHSNRKGTKQYSLLFSVAEKQRHGTQCVKVYRGHSKRVQYHTSQKVRPR